MSLQLIIDAFEYFLMGIQKKISVRGICLSCYSTINTTKYKVNKPLAAHAPSKSSKIEHFSKAYKI